MTDNSSENITLTLSGELTHSTIEDKRQAALDALNKMQSGTLVLNMEEVTRIDSMGITGLVAIHTKAKSKGVQTRIEKLGPKLLELLNLVKINHLFQI